jgi:hypothetical protein
MLKYLSSLVVITAVVNCYCAKALAQQQTGCLLPNGKIHYQENGISRGKTNYNATPNVLSTAVFCEEDVLVNSDCCVDNKNNPANQGSKVKFYLYECPIDDYVPLLILAIGGFGFFSIRRLKPFAS